VASGLNPRQTFLELIEPQLLPSQWREKAERFKFNLIAPLFALNLNLREPPCYAAAEKNPRLSRAFMVILGLDHDSQYGDIVRHHEAGTVPQTVMWGSCPTLFDPSQAPPGMHTAFMWEKLPYRLHGDAANWDGFREQHGRDMLDLWASYAPNLKDAVIDWFTRSPLDTERTLHNMHEGDLLVGAFTHGQIGDDRPFPGAGHYRGHVKGLYLCGSSSHPGGNITGLPAYNCAQVVLADLGIAAPWAPPPAERLLEKL
jgi:phytoene dehydrogenase-like protein